MSDALTAPKLLTRLPEFVRRGHEFIAFSDGDRGDYDTDDTVVTDIAQAHGLRSAIVGTESFADGGLHRPILDIDLPAALIPSSTDGHFHLYLDKPMTWEQYLKLVDVMAEVGIIEPGYAKAVHDRGYSSVRLPWINRLNQHRAADPFGL